MSLIITNANINTLQSCKNYVYSNKINKIRIFKNLSNVEKTIEFLKEKKHGHIYAQHFEIYSSLSQLYLMSYHMSCHHYHQ